MTLLISIFLVYFLGYCFFRVLTYEYFKDKKDKNNRIARNIICVLWPVFSLLALPVCLLTIPIWAYAIGRMGEDKEGMKDERGTEKKEMEGK